LALTEGKKKGDTSLSSLQRDLETAQQNDKNNEAKRSELEKKSQKIGI